jgi:hypothetical protein
MRTLLRVATLFPMALLAAHGQAVPPGWRALFNGKDFDGWEVADARGKPPYTVEDGMLRTQAGNGALRYTREKLGNATLRVIYRMANSKGSGGIVIRPGMEVRIDDRGDDAHVTGTLDSLTKALSHAVKAEGEWNTLDITMQGTRTIVKLNGALVTDYDGGSGEPGYIALRCADGHAAIWFREISVK